jgi:dolichol-phosphate mannosyltransferase
MPADRPKGRKLVSIVVPVFNEEGNIERLYETVLTTLAPEAERYDLEFVFTDNHSIDRSYAILQDLARRDPRVRVFRFSRNFGYQKSIFTGYGKARGDCAVQLDCDLQDPPRLIRDFLRLWEAGHQVVYGLRRQRPEGMVIHGLRRFFYWLVDALSSDQIPRDAGDFRLIDRRILDELKLVNDTSIYIRGRIATMGFSQVGVPYDRDDRRFGESKFNLASMMRLAIDAVTSHSVVPLRLATYCGLATTGLAVLAVIGYALARVTFGINWPPGFTTLTVLIVFGIGLNALFLGIIGEYLARIFEQLKLSSGTIIESEIDATHQRQITGEKG